MVLLEALVFKRHLAEGRTYRAIAAVLPPDAEISPRNLRDHFANGHLDLDAQAVQRASRQQGQALQAAREPLVQGKAAHLSFAHSLLGRVAERLDSGEVQPEIRDGLAAARLLAQTEEAAGQQAKIDDYVTALVTLIDTVREHVIDETFTKIGRALARDPIIRDLADGPHEP